ncbi:ACT domain-containing protein, partial [Ectopseudomonas hydrolytica]|uniref:ACT domain-containing protein n=1 Tax=Ectopseudomonas hydrolytica TaxID=2493633 RepID=UPI003C2F1DEA
LRAGDIANMGFAEAVDCPVILVADIDKGGEEDNTASMSITVEIPGLDALGRLLARIGQLPNIIEARRHRVA